VSPAPRTAAIVAIFVICAGWLMWLRDGAEVSDPVLGFAVNPDLAIRAGPARGRPVVAVFGDIECPACANFDDVAGRKLREDAGRRGWTFLFFHVPLPGHVGGYDAAIAHRCAAVQGKGWPMWDALTRDKDQWLGQPDRRARLVSYARALGVDVSRFSTCLDAPESAEWLEKNRRTAQRLRIDAIPAVFVDGRRVLPRPTYSDVLAAVRETDRSRDRAPAAGSRNHHRRPVSRP
jgi:protein-disulfide isomerase